MNDPRAAQKLKEEILATVNRTLDRRFGKEADPSTLSATLVSKGKEEYVAPVVIEVIKDDIAALYGKVNILITNALMKQELTAVMTTLASLESRIAALEKGMVPVPLPLQQTPLQPPAYTAPLSGSTPVPLNTTPLFNSGQVLFQGQFNPAKPSSGIQNTNN